MLAELKPAVQHYHWGKKSPHGIVAQISREISQGKPCAELWFGAHPTAPSTIDIDGKDCRLDSILESELPFLVKFLSINRDFGLSIQVHPDSEQAKRLNKEMPTLYPDPRAKEELAIALTDVSLLHGIKSEQQLSELFGRYPELAKRFATGSNRERFEALYKMTAAEITFVVESVAQSLDDSDSARAFKRLRAQYGSGDPGLLAFFLLNYLTLKPGEAIFTAPGTLHAYLDGELLEVLSNSDNVVRGGLTPKPCDSESLLLISNWIGGRSELSCRDKTALFDGFRIPTKAFAVRELQSYSGSFALTTNGSPMILVCLGGDCELKGKTGKRIKLGLGGAAFISVEESFVWTVARCADLLVVSSGA